MAKKRTKYVKGGRQAAGLCLRCGLPRDPASAAFCPAHFIESRTKAREYARRMYVQGARTLAALWDVGVATTG